MSLLHPQLSMLIKLQFFDIYQCIQVISMKKDMLSDVGDSSVFQTRVVKYFSSIFSK